MTRQPFKSGAAFEVYARSRLHWPRVLAILANFAFWGAFAFVVFTLTSMRW